LFNENLALLKNANEAKEKTTREWEAMSKEEKQQRNEAAKAKWKEQHPPPPPETDEDKARCIHMNVH
jgi:hypothetical protein